MKKNEMRWIKILDEAGLGRDRPFTMAEGIEILRDTPQVRSKKFRDVPNHQRMRVALLRSNIFEIKTRNVDTNKTTTWIRKGD